MATIEDMRPLLRPVDVAELLNVSRKTAYRLIERGEPSAVHVGTSVGPGPRTWPPISNVEGTDDRPLLAPPLRD